MTLIRTGFTTSLLAVVIALIGAPAHGSSLAAQGPVPGAPTGVTAFVDVGVVPMDTDRVLEHQTVLVQGGRIQAIGPVAQVRVPAGATTIAGKGDYLIPGLTDMHAHIFLAVPNYDPSKRDVGVDTTEVDSAKIEDRLFLWLANGATTIRNMDWMLVDSDHGSASERVALTKQRSAMLLAARARAAAGALLAPRFYTAGPWMDVGTFTLTKTSDTSAAVAYHIAPKDVAKYVAAYKKAGYDFLKPYVEDRELFDSLAAAGKRLGLQLAGHVPPTVPVEHALPLMKSIEHMTGYNKRNLKDTAVVRALVDATRKAGTWNCVTVNTLGVFDMFHSAVNFAAPGVPYPTFAKALSDGGAKLLLGTDAFPRRGALAEELSALVSAGLTPYQALVMGTRNPAEYFGTQAETGTIAVGKRADLVLITGNPFENILSTAYIDGVMLGGRWVPRDTIERHVRDIDSR